MEYWQPRIIEHVFSCGTKEFAIHEVYFNSKKEAYTWTQDALSNRYKSISELWDEVERYVELGDKQKIGDLQYEYDKERFEHWLIYKNEDVVKTSNHETTKEEDLNYWKEQINLWNTDTKASLGLT